MAKFLKAQIPAFFIAVVVIIVGLMRALPALLRGELPGNDDYMRLAVVRDFLSGQSFQDLTQYRLYPPDPLQSHWARLQDIFLSAIIKPLTPLIGAPAAELTALILLPSLLLLIMLMLTVAIARRLSDDEWTPLCAALIAGLCFPLMAQFSPGRIDHHGLQIVLALGAVLALLKSEGRGRWAIVSGALAATGLWVGTESLPWIAGLCAALSISWALDPEKHKPALRAFGLSLFAGCAALLLISRPSSAWMIAACDALSSVYVLMTLGIASAMLAASALGAYLKNSLIRIGVIAALGVAACLITLVVFPQCLSGPYAELDPKLERLWLSNVAEAKPLLSFLMGDPVTGLALIIVPVMAVLSAFIIRKSKSLRAQFIADTTSRTLWICLAFALLGGLVQLRLMTFAGAFAAPLAAAMMVWGVMRADKINNVVARAFARSAAILLLSPLALPLLVMAITPKNEPLDSAKSRIDVADNGEVTLRLGCNSPLALRRLASLEPGLMVTQIDLGAPILVATPHSVTSAPYHRNEAGNVLALDVFTGTQAQAKDHVAAINADYIVFCKDFPETQLMKQINPDGFIAQLLNGKRPDWLQEGDFGEDYPLAVYKIRK